MLAKLDEAWLREVARDLMALGSVVFYVLVLGRALVGPYWDLATPLAVAGAGLVAGAPLLHGVDLYVARALLVALLVTRHYGDPIFGAFAAVAFALLVLAAVWLGHGAARVAAGVGLGAVLGAAGYVAAGWFD
ncbi:MAG TPA: hypothetical protein VFU14_16550 [Acidimicrobiales bacterium]|nr:hypothetical protein [Acidimicrobiales bacterium]